MEHLAERLENATAKMSRILAERNGGPRIFEYLNPADQEFVAKKTMEQHFEREQLQLQRQRCDDMLSRYQVLVELGIDLDVVTKNEIRQYVSHLGRQEFKIPVVVPGVVSRVPDDDGHPACPGCENCTRRS